MKFNSILPAVALAILGLKVSDPSRMVHPVVDNHIVTSNNLKSNLNIVSEEDDFDYDRLVAVAVRTYSYGEWKWYNYVGASAVEIATAINKGLFNLGNTSQIAVTFTEISYLAEHEDNGSWVISSNLPPRNKIKCPPSPWNLPKPPKETSPPPPPPPPPHKPEK